MFPCEPWLTRADVCTDNEVSANIVAAAIASATAWMFDATCAQFTGVCTSTLRPRTPCGHDACAVDCRGGWRRLDLSPWVTGPIRTIEEITVDGVAIDAADYRLAGARWLIPHEGGALIPWPTQRMDRADGDEDTWSVNVTHGIVVPPHVADAAADLAKQLVARCTGGECLLPDNATSISRDGVTVELNVPTNGRTGLPLVDSVIEMYPCKRTRRLHDPAELEPEVQRLLG